MRLGCGLPRAGLGLGLSLLFAVLACASAPPAPAALSVAVLSGAPATATTLGEAPAPPSRVAIVVDLSSSMQAPLEPGGPTAAAAARAAAIRLLDSLPPDTGVLLETLGAASGSACTSAVSMEATPSASGDATPSRPASLAAPLGVLAPHSESSLAETLQRVGDAVERSGSSAGWHVVVMSDLGAECGGDPCAAIAGLVERGVPVDVVALGNRDAHTCPLPALPAPALTSRLAPAPPPSFRVVAPEDAEVPGALLARGRANGAPVTLPAGRARILVDLDPPLAIGPFSLGAGQRSWLRILDFPAAQPPFRAWRLGSEPAAAGGGAR